MEGMIVVILAIIAILLMGIVGAVQPTTLDLVVGEKYFIVVFQRCYIGRVVKLTAKSVVIREVLLVWDSGRLYEALETGNLAKFEPIPDDLMIPASMIVEATRWRHEIPRHAQIPEDDEGVYQD